MRIPRGIIYQQTVLKSVPALFKRIVLYNKQAQGSPAYSVADSPASRRNTALIPFSRKCIEYSEERNGRQARAKR